MSEFVMGVAAGPMLRGPLFAVILCCGVVDQGKCDQIVTIKPIGYIQYYDFISSIREFHNKKKGVHT